MPSAVLSDFVESKSVALNAEETFQCCHVTFCASVEFRLQGRPELHVQLIERTGETAKMPHL